MNIAVNTQHGIINAIKRFGILIEQTISSEPFPDESDRIFYDTAKDCGAILITGNIKHYPVEPFIMIPVEFLEIYENELSIIM